MSLKYKAVFGALWSIGGGILARGIGLVGTLALTHFVAPREYGAVSVTAVAAATANAITIIGFGQYVVANPREGDRTVFHATLFHLLVGALAFGGLWAFRDLLGHWLGTPELSQLLPLILVATIIERLAYTPGRVLTRDMRFRVLALRLLIGEVAYVAVAVGLAAAGLGVMAIVWGILARTVASGALTLFSLSPRKWLDIGPLSTQTTQKMLRYSLPLGAANALHWLSRRGDNLLVAGMFGPAAAGSYNLAYNLADIPATQIGEQIGDVLLPSFAKMQDARARKRALIRAAGLLALVVFPSAVGLGVLAPTLVQAVFDPEWWDIAPMLVLLSILSVLRPLGWLVGAYLQAVQRTRAVLLLEVVKTVGLLALVVALGQIGLLWACAGVGLAFGIHAVASMVVVKRGDGISVKALLMALIPPLAAAFPMALAVLSVRELCQANGCASWLMLAAEVVTGVVTYSASAWLLASHQSRDFVGLLGGAWRRLAPASGAA